MAFCREDEVEALLAALSSSDEDEPLNGTSPVVSLTKVYPVTHDTTEEISASSSASTQGETKEETKEETKTSAATSHPAHHSPGPPPGPSAPPPSHGSTLARPLSIPLSANSISVDAANEGKKENPFNHYQPGDPERQPCKHWRVETWKYDQCADCKKDLGPERLQQETDAAQQVRLEDQIRSLEEQAQYSHERGVSVRWLLTFTCDHDCWLWPTWKVVRDIIIPPTRETRCRYTDLPFMRSFRGRAKIFLSHCWGSTWGDLVGAACHGADPDRFVWIDIFAVRQWGGNDADLDFRGVIQRCNAVIVAVARVEELTSFLSTREEQDAFLASDAGEAAKKNMAFFRLWCIVELAAAIELGKPVVIQGGVVVVNAEGGGRFFDTSGMKVMMDNLTHMVDCENSECAVPADFTREMGHIRTMDGGVDRVNRIVRGVLEGAQHSISAGVPEVDAFVCGERESLRRMGLDVRCQGQERNRALEIVAIASGGGREEVLDELWGAWGLSQLSLEGEGETKASSSSSSSAAPSSSSLKWTKELIDESKSVWIAAKGGHVGVLRRLLACEGVDVDVLGSGGSTPLVVAKQGGHQEIVKMLEDNGATETGASVNLIESVEAAMFDRGFDPFGPAIRRRVAELGVGYVGRSWLAESVVLELQAAVVARTGMRTGSAKVVVVYGDSGTGKTAFFCRVLDSVFCHEKGGAWSTLHESILARFMCTVNDSETLSPKAFACSLAGQVFERLEVAGAGPRALKLLNHESRESLLAWIQSQDSARKVMDTCLLPMLNEVEGVREALEGRDTIWLDSLDEALTFGAL